MKEKLYTSDLKELLARMNAYMEDRRAALAELDSLTGDGDMGVTIALIFRSAVKKARSVDSSSAFAPAFEELSEVIGENAPSTFGTFVSTMLMSMADNCGDMTEIGGAEFAQLLGWAAEGVMKRGGAKLGDKTLLDALIPAGEAAAAAAGKGLCAAAAAAALAAAQGADKTSEMMAKLGRAGYMGERSIGSKDPGAQAIADILASVADYLAA